MIIPKLSKLIKDSKFDWVNPDITDDLFAVPKDIGTDFKLFHFDKFISSEDAIKEMDNEGYRPANAWEILGYANNGWNSKNLVVGLGSVGKVNGNRHVPCLDRSASERRLSLSWWDFAWDAFYRFLGVRHSVSKVLETSDGLGHFDTLTLDNAIKIVKKAGYKINKTIMITITKHQETVDDVAGEPTIEIGGIGGDKIKFFGFDYKVTLTIPEARELQKALSEKLK